MENSFQIILHAGNARSSAMEAIACAKAEDFIKAKEKLEDAKKEITESHYFQTELIQAEARGEGEDVNVILVHAQDHLMTAMVVKDLAAEFVELYKKINCEFKR